MEFNEWQAGQDATDFDLVWQAALSGTGSPYFTMPVFLKFADYVISRGAVVEYTEVFEHTDKGLMSRTDLGMWNFPRAEWPFDKKLNHMTDELNRFQESLAAEGQAFSVVSWLDTAD